MPYFITDKSEDCPNWAVVKSDGSLIEGGCHDSKDKAVAHMVAASLSEDLEPGGEYSPNILERAYDDDEEMTDRAEPGEVSVGDFVEWDSSGGMARGRIEEIVLEGTVTVPDTDFEITAEEDDPAALIRIYRQGETDDGEEWMATETIVGHKLSTLTKIEDLTRSYLGMSMRAVNLEPPAYMRAAARRGLAYFEEGLGGDGLRQRTINEARAMARGNVTADKWVRLRAWIARHLVDLDAPDADPESPNYPSNGVVAHLLWGSGPSKRAAQRVYDYADEVIGRMEKENEGRTRGKALKALELRVNQVDYEIVDSAEGMRFEGYAAVFDSDSRPLPGSRSESFIERIAPGAFLRSLKSRNDIKLLWNHDTSEVLGSTRSGTMKLVEDDRGLKVIATLPNTSRGRDAAELLRRGDVDAMSFGFTVPRGGDDWNTAGTERVLREVMIHEVSLVAFPAYEGTTGTTSVRGLAKVAERADVDVDALSDALLKLENGEDMTEEDARLLTEVLDSIAPEKPEADNVTEEDNSLAMLALKKKKLELLMGA
jgi:hypothetical protein